MREPNQIKKMIKQRTLKVGKKIEPNPQLNQYQMMKLKKH
jgi:hypothetical protein